MEHKSLVSDILKGMEHKSLVSDIIKGMEQVKQLQLSSAKSDQERMLASYEEALLILTGRAPQRQCQSLTSSLSDPPGSSGHSSVKRKSREDGAVKIITSEQEYDDGYSWRKYGTKELLGSKFPRSYYRCVQGRGCSARKHIQRSYIDPTKFEVTYNGGHTCQAGASAKTGIITPSWQASHSATSDK